MEQVNTDQRKAVKIHYETRQSVKPQNNRRTNGRTPLVKKVINDAGGLTSKMNPKRMVYKTNEWRKYGTKMYNQPYGCTSKKKKIHIFRLKKKKKSNI